MRDWPLRRPFMSHLPAVKSLATPRFPAFGSKEAICPHCSAPLKRFPKARCKCPTCKSFIRVAVRECDGATVIVSIEDEAELNHQRFLKDVMRTLGKEERLIYDAIAQALLDSKGQWPRHLEVLYRVFLKQEQTDIARGLHLAAISWRNRRADVLWQAGRLHEGICLIIECCYIDFCNPLNTFGASEMRFAPWQKEGDKWVQRIRTQWSDQDNEMPLSETPLPTGLLQEIAWRSADAKLDDARLTALASRAVTNLDSYCAGVVSEATFVEHLMHYLKPHLLEARRQVLEDAEDETDSD